MMYNKFSRITHNNPHLVFESLVNDINALINDRKTLPKLLLVDNERGIDENRVPTDECKDAILTKISTKWGHGAYEHVLV